MNPNRFKITLCHGAGIDTGTEPREPRQKKLTTGKSQGETGHPAQRITRNLA